MRLYDTQIVHSFLSLPDMALWSRNYGIHGVADIVSILYRFNMYISTYIYLININCEDWTEGLHLSFNQSIGPFISSRSVNRNFATGQMWPNHFTLFNLVHISKFDQFEKGWGDVFFYIVNTTYQLYKYIYMR